MAALALGGSRRSKVQQALPLKLGRVGLFIAPPPLVSWLDKKKRVQWFNCRIEKIRGSGAQRKILVWYVGYKKTSTEWLPSAEVAVGTAPLGGIDGAAQERRRAAALVVKNAAEAAGTAAAAAGTVAAAEAAAAGGRAVEDGVAFVLDTSATVITALEEVPRWRTSACTHG